MDKIVRRFIVEIAENKLTTDEIKSIALNIKKKIYDEPQIEL